MRPGSRSAASLCARRSSRGPCGENFSICVRRGSSMKAEVFLALGQPLKITEAESPQPQRDQVLLKICRCGICGSDLHMTTEPVFGISSGCVLGHEISGDVIEVGPEVDHLKPG